MKKFVIGTELYPDALSDCLLRVGDELKKSGLDVRGERFARGNCTFFTYRILGTNVGREDERTLPVARRLADAVAEYVTDVWEYEELKRIVASDFYYYAEDEVEYLAASSVQMLADLLGPDGEPLRRSHIAAGVLELLLRGGELLVEGMLRFRMQALAEDHHRVVEQAIDEYLMDLEYQEFIKLLRYFLEAQENELPLLHMMCYEETDARLYRADGREIMPEDLPDGIGAMSATSQGVRLEDLMSSLISLAPEKLHIHVRPGLPGVPLMVETVQKVFQERAVLCAGCPLCLSVPQLQNVSVET